MSSSTVTFAEDLTFGYWLAEERRNGNLPHFLSGLNYALSEKEISKAQQPLHIPI